jgi:hypothetical protein
VAPIFVVPQGPAGIVSGVSNAVVSGIDILGFNASNYTFTVLNGTQSINGLRVIDNRFIVENNQLRLTDGVTLQNGGAFNLVIEARDAQGNVFRSSGINLFTNNGGLQVGGAGAGNTVIYAEGAAPVSVLSSLTLVGGAGAPTQLNGASIAIGTGYIAGEDFLSIAGSRATSGTVDGLTWRFENGVLTLSGPGSVATYQNVLRQVTYFNASQNATATARTINVLIGGGPLPFGQANLVINIATTDSPGSFQFAAAPTLTAGISGAVVGAIGINDPDSRYRLAIGGAAASQFEVVGSGPNGWQLRLIPGQTIAAGNYVIPLIATDLATGATLNQDLNLTVLPPVTDAYTITGLLPAGGGATATYAERQASPVVVSSGLTIAGGPAGGSLNGALIAINGFSAAQSERLSIAGQAANSGAIAGTGITWVYDPATGVMTFSGAGTVADYQNALRQVTYSNGSSAPFATRLLTYTVGTGAQAGQGFAAIGINATNDLPTALGLSTQLVPTGVAGAVFANVSVTDPDAPNGGPYTYVVTGGGDLFEVVNGQLKLKAGATIVPGQVIPDVSITVIDPGAPNGGRYTQNFWLSTGVGPSSEIYWRNDSSNSSIFWNLNNARELVGGTQLRYGAGIGDARAGQPVLFPSTAQVVGLADMNGDGANDIVLLDGRDITVATIGQFNGRSVSVEAQAAPTFGAFFGALSGQAARSFGSYQLVDIADMNGDGQADYVFTGAAENNVVIWTANRQNQITNGAVVGGPALPGKLEAILDLDGDGDKDFLWRNGSSIFAWQMNGGTFVRQIDVAPTLATSPQDFVLEGVGDFNADGIEDVVWRSVAANKTVIWLFDNQGLPSNISVLPTVNGADWKIGALADLDGDGTTDILWRKNADDLTAYWRISNAQLDLTRSGEILDRQPGSSGGVFKTLSPAWNIAGVNGVARSTAG